MDTLHTILYSLTVGSYLFTAWVFRYLVNKLDAFTSNHLKNIIRKEIEQAFKEIQGRK